MLYIRGQGRYQAEYERLWDELVPESGQAETRQGELVRVIGRLASEYYRNGRGNWDMGFRIYTNYLYKHLLDSQTFDEATLNQIQASINTVRSWGSGKMSENYTEIDNAMDCITDRTVEWCQQHPTPVVHKHNPKLKR